MKKFLKWILAGILTAGSIAMCVSAYGKFSDSVTVTNHISTGDINISMKELEKKNAANNSSDFDETFYGDETFDPSELDEEGFADLNMDDEYNNM